MSARSLVHELNPELASWLVSPERLEAGAGTRATGIGGLDDLLRGGWARGALSEIAGPRSSGRTAVVLHTLATAGVAGEATALIDVGGALDARAAAACGVPLPTLLWIRCAPEQALKAADLVVTAGGFGVVAVDLGDARLRTPDAAWLRLQHAARNQTTTVLVSAATRAARAFAATAVELGPRAPRFLTDGPALFAGLDAQAVRARAVRPANDQLRNPGTGSAPPAMGSREQSSRSPDANGLSPCVSLAFTFRS